MRAIQEFSYDIFKSVKAQEIEVPNTLKMILPQDYVNYTKLARVGSDGVERVLYPTGKTSNPSPILQDSSDDYDFGTSSSRKITIEVPDYTTLVDGDYVVLSYPSGSLNFVFNKDDDNNDNTSFPAGSNNNPRVPVPMPGSATTAEHVAEKFADVINNMGFHTATYSGGVVTITYNNAWNSVYEGAFEADSTTTNDNFTITIPNAGTEPDENLQYQEESDTWGNYKSQTSNGNSDDVDSLLLDAQGRRYGLDPQHAQSNGTFYIDTNNGYINFGSSLAGETVVLHYISDGLGTDGEMVVHKFAEEAVYKWIAYGVIASRSNMPEYIVQRFKKERFAEARKAKIRLSNIKIEEFAQVLKGLGKPIK
jgi:hypothetical protein